jgi:membrane dipeptidase
MYRILGFSTLFISFPLAIALAADDAAKAKPQARGEVKLTEEGLKVHRAGLLIDGHNDLPWMFREKKDPSFLVIDINKPQPALNTDIPRLRKGGVGAQFWSAFVPASFGKKGIAVRETLEQIDIIHRMVRAYPDTFEMASTADDIVRIHAKGKIASMVGVEGGHSIDNSLAVLRMLYPLGVRYMTLTHSETLDWADSATDKPKSHGLSKFGEQVVREMNKLGMLVDISHVSAETMRHAIRVSRAPVIASHSSAFAVANHPRNVPDDVLKMIKERDGVVMVNFFSGFVVPEAARLSQDMFQVMRELQAKYPNENDFSNAMRQYGKEHPLPAGTVHDVVDHIEHIIQIAGVEHVGLGSDFDGVTQLPVQLKDVSCYPYITQELLNRGHSAEEIHKVMGANVLRVMRKAEQVARQMNAPGASVSGGSVGTR